jgi:hypothetical protein
MITRAERRFPVRVRVAVRQKLVERLRGRGDFKMTTDEVVALMRGPPAE